eukprot:CAMPEP_0114561392 /NCGR_PEP_ID=MMETSP0114-20121206/11979_1 /TAXON_ID=31324 /ORGANISM="Goniomonas sp, Strain m" /LENGTH=258 /DNA_ID=CAMNT_0001747023 /DNA_START=15 /DNA_END=791 /DNA_ORIENTATION=+
MAGKWHNAFEGLPSYIDADPLNTGPVAETAAGLRQIPGYTGHVPNLTRRCGESFGNATANLAMTACNDDLFRSSVNIKNIVDQAQFDGDPEAMLGVAPREMPEKVRTRIVPGYQGQKPGMARCSARTFGSYAEKTYNVATKAARNCEQRDASRYIERVDYSTLASSTEMEAKFGKSRVPETAHTGPDEPKGQRKYIPGTTCHVPDSTSRVGESQTIASAYGLAPEGPPPFRPPTKHVDWCSITKNFGGHIPATLPDYY